jgi:hypothetical protein
MGNQILINLHQNFSNYTQGVFAMRSDAANLLNRLGQNNFRYQEFRDNFADMELWPLFEALIRDPRISGEAGHRDDPARGKHHAAGRTDTNLAPAPPPVRSGGLFGRYDERQPEQPQAQPRTADDVRSLLQQLNDRVAAGEL